MANKKASADTEKPTAASPRPAVTELPDRTPTVTAERAFQTAKHDPVVEAFLATERLRGDTRKLTRAEWKKQLEEFKAAPRP